MLWWLIRTLQTVVRITSSRPEPMIVVAVYAVYTWYVHTYTVRCSKVVNLSQLHCLAFMLEGPVTVTSNCRYSLTYPQFNFGRRLIGNCA